MRAHVSRGTQRAETTAARTPWCHMHYNDGSHPQLIVSQEGCARIPIVSFDFAFSIMLMVGGRVVFRVGVVIGVVIGAWGGVRLHLV